MARAGQRAAHVGQHECAGAIGRLDLARIVAALADGGGLLVAREAADGERGVEQSRRGGPELARKKQLLLDITTEGLRIQIVDEKNRPMFASAKAELQPYTKEILHEIGKTLNEVPNKITLSGHTDATPYANAGTAYSNWELSTDRANASRRELIAGGMDDDKMLRVVGLASAIPFDKEQPMGAINRRISIIVMNKKTEDAVVKDGGVLAAKDGAEVKAGLTNTKPQ